MLNVAEAAIEDLLLDGRWPAAFAAVRAWRAGDLRGEPSLRRLAAGVYALGGRDRAVAATVDPRMLAGAGDVDVATLFANQDDDARSHDYLAAAVVATWSGNAKGAYANLHVAHDRALRERRAAFAIGSLERCAHHALLFGDVSKARAAISDASALAAERQSQHWRARCTAFAARIAAEVGELDVAGALLERERASLLPPDALALFAPTGAYLALTAGDAAALEMWTSARVLDTALHSEALDSSTAAAAACLFASGADRPAMLGAAVRRALLAAESSAGAVELFSSAARLAGDSEAHLALMALGAAAAPNRRYLEAHHRLAEAHAGFRFGKRAAVDHASDAARAFDSLGLRRWTNEAMLLLVHRERSPEPSARRRPTALSLTEREQQVAHLIRRGGSNREIAHTLQISEHTVERHVSSILSRLGLRSRWQIVDARKLDV